MYKSDFSVLELGYVDGCYKMSYLGRNLGLFSGGFYKNLFEEKQYEPDVLFGNVKFNSELKNHPGIEWRLRNI
jgi:hypothetical protein